MQPTPKTLFLFSDVHSSIDVSILNFKRQFTIRIGAISEKSVWWLKLGNRPEPIEPTKLQTNSRHERIHRS